MGRRSSIAIAIPILILIAIGIFYAGYQVGRRSNQPGPPVPSSGPITRASSLQGSILGKWEKIEGEGLGGAFAQFADPNESIEFLRDETIVLYLPNAVNARSTTGDYKFVDKDRVRVNFPFFDPFESIVFTVSISGGQLILEGPPGYGVSSYRSGSK